MTDCRGGCTTTTEIPSTTTEIDSTTTEIDSTPATTEEDRRTRSETATDPTETAENESQSNKWTATFEQPAVQPEIALLPLIMVPITKEPEIIEAVFIINTDESLYTDENFAEPPGDETSSTTNNENVQVFDEESEPSIAQMEVSDSYNRDDAESESVLELEKVADSVVKNVSFPVLDLGTLF